MLFAPLGHPKLLASIVKNAISCNTRINNYKQFKNQISTSSVFHVFNFSQCLGRRICTFTATDGTGGNPLWDKQANLKDAFDLTKDKSTYWRKIGRELGVPFNAREGLGNSNNKDDEDKLEFILNTWIESNGASATWSKLINALKEIGLKHTAEKIERYFGKLSPVLQK